MIKEGAETFAAKIRRLIVARGSFVFLGGLIFYTGFLLLGHYQSQVELKKVATENFENRVVESTEKAEYFFSERRNDVKDVAASQEVHGFFANEALGMSMQYGLQSSLSIIDQRFKEVIQRETIYGEPIYSRLALTDANGKLLADSKIPMPDRFSINLPQNHFRLKSLAGHIGIERGPNRNVFLVSIPYFFKGQHKGSIVAWLSSGSFTRLLRHQSPGQHEQESICLLDSAGQHFFSDCPLVQSEVGEFFPGKDHSVARGELNLYSFIFDKKVFNKRPINGTPFSILASISSKELYGSVSPWQSLLGTAFLAIIFLFGGWKFSRANTQNLVLTARFEEASKQQSLLEEQKQQLEKEASKREQAEEILRRQKNFLDNVVSLSPVYLFWKDRNSNYLGCNRLVAELAGLEEPDQVVGKKDSDLSWKSYAEKFVEDDRVVLDGKKELQELEFDLALQDGTFKSLHVKKGPLINDQGHIVGLVGVGMDVSVHKLAEKKLLEAKEAAEAGSLEKSQFIANVSHELRTPLNGILGMCELVEDSLRPEQQHYFKTIQKSGESLLNLINNILEFSKIEAGKLKISKSDFNLRNLVEEAARLMAGMAHEKGLDVAVWMDDNLPEMNCGDANRLQQVLLNLIGNAIKFTEQGGVLVEVLPTHEDVKSGLIQFQVTDTGAGIDPGKKELLFKPFSQGDNSSTRKFGGTGLGLVICKDIVEAMGGEIGFESHVGAGSIFRFEIPLEEVPTGDSEKQTIPENFCELIALVIDPDRFSREIMQKQLSSWGVLCEAAENTEKALGLFGKESGSDKIFDLILHDSNLEGIDTEEWKRAAQNGPPGFPRFVSLIPFAQKCSNNTKKNFSGWCLEKPVLKNALWDLLVETTNGAVPSAERMEAAQIRSTFLETWSDCRVLLVEDNLVNQTVFMGMFSKMGCQAVLAGNGIKGVEAASSQPFDIIFMDCQMPEMDGFEATRLIREKERGGHGERVPIVALTAHGLEGDREKCLSSDMDDYICKPAPIEQMMQMIRKWVPADRLTSSAVPDSSCQAVAGTDLE